MNEKLKALGAQLAKQGLPLLGTLLGGPAGGAIGALVASAIGGDPADADGLAQIVATDPDALVRLRELENSKVLRLQELVTQQAVVDMQETTKQLEAVGVTMRSEGTSEHWPQYSWRPYWGFISGTAFAVVCVFVCVLAYKAILGTNPNAVAMIPQLVGAFTMLFGIPGAILGVAAWHRGVEKRLRVAPGSEAANG